MPNPDDRRHFHRITFDKTAQLELADKIIECELIDLCLQGALVETKQPNDIAIGSPATLSFSLGDEQHTILMTVNIAHQTGQCLGLHCDTIDINSISHLRRLLELNLGDAELLKRDFKALSSDL
ncbi:PilZ domain-containing protein [Pleionea litopenaei]|uniref:Cyclic diguanosine monophosphate-binding protein n=1 Tax=Pleionea litopenaei TaxID=3070815 RepID=A0AA51X619_9GAMM|nr:PilZ domain-containing protein [Pleionea sp. HL-JVS1]WMS86648.1 PilZ domain-containing protein [Pleionea sp. HL-JVS1]